MACRGDDGAHRLLRVAGKARRDSLGAADGRRIHHGLDRSPILLAHSIPAPSIAIGDGSRARRNARVDAGIDADDDTPPDNDQAAERHPHTGAPAPAAGGLFDPSQLLGRDLSSMQTTSKVIALTFDGGASNAGVAPILETLARTGTPATFFLTGDFAREFPADSQRIAARYPVGNHTEDHPDLTTLSDQAVQAQIRTGQASIKEVTGVDPRPYFRFPFGARDSRTIRLVNGECYVPFRWTVDTLGWQGTSGGMTTSKVTQRVFDGASSGGIILLHLGNNPTDKSTLDADALPGIIWGLKQRGYRFVTLEHVLPAAP